MIPAKSNCQAHKLARIQRGGSWPWNTTVTYVTRPVAPIAYDSEQVTFGSIPQTSVLVPWL